MDDDKLRRPEEIEKRRKRALEASSRKGPPANPTNIVERNSRRPGIPNEILSQIKEGELAVISDSIRESALEGNPEAIHKLLFGAYCFIHALEDLASQDEGTVALEAVREVAKTEPTWPSVVSASGTMRGFIAGSKTPTDLKHYLERISLGSELNLNPRRKNTADPLLPLMWRILRSLREEFSRIERDGLDRDKWISSDKGKRIERALIALLEKWHGENWQEWREFESLRPRVSGRARSKQLESETINNAREVIVLELMRKFHGMLDR